MCRVCTGEDSKVKRILIVTYDIYPHEGGKSTHIKYLVEGLSELGVYCEVFSFANVNQLENNFGKLLMQPCKLKGKDCYLYYRLCVGKYVFKQALKNKLKTKHYDMISTQDAVSGSILSKILPQGQCISLTMHTYFGLENGLDNKVLKEGNKYYDRMKAEEITALESTKAVIAVDDRIKNHVNIVLHNLNMVGKCNIFCIKNFVNTNLFKACSKRKNGEALEVICVRRLVEKNGVIFAVKALSYCDDNVHLHIIGDGPQLETIQNYVNKYRLNKRVTFYGGMKNEEVIKAYESCNAAIIPSITVNHLQEATSISALEAMACGMPVVASSIGGLKELINDGSTGFLAEERNAEQIGKKLQWIYEHPEQSYQIGQNAREFIQKNHSHLSAAKRYLDIFSENIIQR